MVKKIVGMMLVAGLVAVNAQTVYANATLAREAATLASESKTFARFVEGVLGKSIKEGAMTAKEQGALESEIAAALKSGKNSKFEQALSQAVSQSAGLKGKALESKMVVALSTGAAAELVKANAAKSDALLGAMTAAAKPVATKEAMTCDIGVSGVTAAACTISAEARANLEKGVRQAGTVGSKFADYIGSLNQFSREQAIAAAKKIAGCPGVADGCNLITGDLKNAVCAL